MAGSFLGLELDNFGITARIVEQRYKDTFIKDHCRVLFEDLKTREEKIDLFDAGMDSISQKLDLDSCSAAVIFVSPFFVSFRNIDLPFSSEKKAKQVLPFELETKLPLINETYISDFHFLGLIDETNLFLSASIAESRVEKIFLKLEEFGIKPLIITPKGYALTVSLLKERKSVSNFAFVHITDFEITIVLVINQKPWFVRSFSAPHISPSDIALSLGQSIIGFNQRTGLDTAFDIFICADTDLINPNYINTTLEKILESLAGLRPAEQAAQNPLVQEKINCEPLLLNITPDNTIKYVLNFCQGKYGTSSFLKKYFSNIAAGFVLFCCVLALLMLSVGSDNSKLERKIAAIDNRALSIFTTTFPDKKKVQDAYLQMKANVQDTIKKSGTNKDKDQLVKNKDVKIVEMMSELSKKIDSTIDIDVSRFLFNDGRLVLSGSTSNFNNVDLIKSKIESSDYFNKVNISSAAASKSGDRVDFKFIIEM